VMLTVADMWSANDFKFKRALAGKVTLIC
jgi:hypothetical protein